MSLRRLDDRTWVAGAVTPQDLDAAVGLGVTRIVNNRPDHEDPGQPASDVVAGWARDAGLDYAWIPIAGRPDADAVQATTAVLADDAAVLVFCRSGLRSAAAWAASRVTVGALTPEDARAAAARAGFDLSGLPL
ncbi:TIGR01244 family sulfur transferase [Brevundimonas sp.]|uniref:TIGR01244 family sulfur transferase n=1 Tax=Brevundimonas sp. TaxID=1871086 RepID=UPI00391BC6DA